MGLLYLGDYAAYPQSFPTLLRWVPRNPNDRIHLLSQVREQLDYAKRDVNNDEKIPADYVFHLLTAQAMIQTALAEFPNSGVNIIYRDVCQQIESRAKPSK